MIGLDRLILEVAHPAMLHIPGANINQHEPVSLKTMLDNFDSVMSNLTMIVNVTLLLEGNISKPFPQGEYHLYVWTSRPRRCTLHVVHRQYTNFFICISICTWFSIDFSLSLFLLIFFWKGFRILPQSLLCVDSWRLYTWSSDRFIHFFYNC